MPQRGDKKIGLLLHLREISGGRLKTRKATRLLGVTRLELWALVSELLKEGTITEPGGKGSQVYVIEGVPPIEAKPPSGKEASRAKTSAWTKKNREQWGVEPKKRQKRA